MITTTILAAVALGLAQQPATDYPLPPRTEHTGLLAITNARIVPVSTEPIDRGTLLVQDGMITAVGSDVAIPASARVIDADGRTVIPGLVESHSHMGFKQLWRGTTTGSNNNELSQPINAEARAVDGLNAHDPAFAVALAAGVTTMNITPGSRSPNSGQAVIVKLRGRTIDEMTLAPGGMKFAMRLRSRSEFGLTIQESRALIAERLRAAQRYRAAREGPDPPDQDLEHEAFSRLLAGDWPVGVHAHGEESMRLAISLKDEFPTLRLYIHHADATTELAEELARKGIPISFGPVLPGLGREDPELLGPVRLNELGGLVSIHQDHPDGPQYWLRESAALFVRMGMSAADALKALTINPARILGVDDRVGSLEPGKDADFLILDGPPLEWTTRVQRSFIDGVEVYDRGAERAGAGT